MHEDEHDQEQAGDHQKHLETDIECAHELVGSSSSWSDEHCLDVRGSTAPDKGRTHRDDPANAPPYRRDSGRIIFSSTPKKDGDKLSVGVVLLEARDLRELLGVEACATDESTVNVRLLH